MANRDWSKSYVIPSLALSLTAAGFLVWDVIDPTAGRVDGWTITLLVVLFVPWLRTVFETIQFPGGGSVTWRNEVEAEQERQAEDIEALRFLLTRFITESEREFLQRLATGDEIPVKVSDQNEGKALGRTLDSLRRLGMISPKPSIIETLSADGGGSVEIKSFSELFEVSASGQQYLDLVGKLPADPESGDA
jgi:hypothetical protein